MHFEEINSGDGLQLNVQGKIDATSAGEFQNSVLRAFIKSKNIVINLEQVPYMSSAGLRALVLGPKTAQAKSGSMIVINVQPAVMEVFRYSGMNKIVEIR
jgi:anti-sigma B factor antagonist